MRDDERRVIVTGLGHMVLIAHPGHAALETITSFQVENRMD